MNSIDANLIKNGTIGDWVVANVPDKNVGELISRKALVNALTNWQMGYAEKDEDDERFETLGAVIELVEQMPTIEPKRGKWEHHIGIGNVALLKCGECGFTYPELLGMMLFNFCPNCGARMSDEHTD